MATALADHDRVLQRVIEAHGGRVFKHTGDGMCVVFGSAPEAVAAAIETQVRLDLPVRMGLHTGEAISRRRLLRTDAQPGGACNGCRTRRQVLASSATRDLCEIMIWSISVNIS